jgi:hypothetical protein
LPAFLRQPRRGDRPHAAGRRRAFGGDPQAGYKGDAHGHTGAEDLWQGEHAREDSAVGAVLAPSGPNAAALPSRAFPPGMGRASRLEF